MAEKFNPSDTARVLLVDEFGVPYKAGGGGGSTEIQVNGVDTSNQGLLDFVDQAPIGWSNPSGGLVKATIVKADATHDGYLSQGDWSTFNGKQSAIAKYSNSISLGDTTSVITHGLADASAILLAAFANWNAGQPFITAQDANTITVTFPNECSLAAGGKLVGGVIHS